LGKRRSSSERYDGWERCLTFNPFSQVIRINVFPSYNSSNFLGDIAVLTLSSDAEFTNYVTPVCLWDEKSDNLDDVVGKDGTVRVLVF